MDIVDLDKEADAALDDLGAWHDAGTSEGERYEIYWWPAFQRMYSGVVVQQGSGYDAYIEAFDGERTSVEWAAMPFPSARSGRAWVESHIA